MTLGEWLIIFKLLFHRGEENDFHLLLRFGVCMKIKPDNACEVLSSGPGPSNVLVELLPINVK